MRVLVCGGRFFGQAPNPATYEEIKLAEEQAKFMEDYLNDRLQVCYTKSDIVLIAGGANGADTVAEEWAVYQGIKTEIYPADWSKYGKRAGFIRNSQMLDEGNPDLVIAFPGGAGTNMMIELAREKGVKVIEVEYK